MFETVKQGRNEVYGIRNQKPEKGRDQGRGIWNHNAWDRDQPCFSWDQEPG